MQGSFENNHTLGKEPQTERRIPVHQQVYQQLRNAVMFGELTPGEAVTIQGLIERTGAGMTPIREAIRRLTSEGALEFRGNRRVIVPTPTIKDINELILLREFIEPQLAAMAVGNITDSQIAELTEIDSILDDSISRGDVEAYLRHNYAFHAKLYAIADAPILNEVAESIWLRFGPAMRVVCGRMGTQNLPDKHKKALLALTARDSEATAEAIREDVHQGMEQMRAAMENSSSFAEVID